MGVSYKQAYTMLTESDAFDPEYYLEENADVAKDGMDPVHHYLLYGWREGRNPSSAFYTSTYANRYVEPFDPGVQPLVYYLLKGEKLGHDPMAAELSRFTFGEIEDLDLSHVSGWVQSSKAHDLKIDFEYDGMVVLSRRLTKNDFAPRQGSTAELPCEEPRFHFTVLLDKGTSVFDSIAFYAGERLIEQVAVPDKNRKRGTKPIKNGIYLWAEGEPRKKNKQKVDLYLDHQFWRRVRLEEKRTLGGAAVMRGVKKKRVITWLRKKVAGLRNQKTQNAAKNGNGVNIHWSDVPKVGRGLHVYYAGTKVPFFDEDTPLAMPHTVSLGENGIVCDDAAACKDALSRADTNVIDAEARSHAEGSTALAGGVCVIVPIYNAYDAVRRCLKSLEDDLSQTIVPYTVLLIDDGSTDAPMDRLLKSYAVKNGFYCFKNPANKGFVYTVNRGFYSAGSADVIILNSDTVVSLGWVAKLRAWAQRENRIGTVTPLSNNATIFSWPSRQGTDAIPQDLSREKLLAIFDARDTSAIIDVPTGHGFCMYIKRAVLDDLGVFDRTLFRHGYGEENDLCLRAALKGWRNIVAYDLYVEHGEATSFGEGKKKLIKAGLKKINRAYPFYPWLIENYIERDPLREVRNRVSKRVIGECLDSNKRTVLSVCHDLGGGTTYALGDHERVLGKHGYNCLRLGYDAKNCTFSLQLPSSEVRVEVKQLALVFELMRRFDVSLMHVHSLLGFPHSALQLFEKSGIPYIVTVHDYYHMCPKVNLLGVNGYCGLEDENACPACVGSADTHRKNQWPFYTIEEWRKDHQRFLERAQTVFFPSRDARDRYDQIFTLRNAKVVPHTERAGIDPVGRHGNSDQVRVLILGAISKQKGLEVITRLCRYAAKHVPEIRFRIVGFTTNDRKLKKYKNLEITGRYQRHQLREHLADFAPDVAFLPSIWPETYSYTLSECWRYGICVIGFDLGAIGQRIRDVGFGKLLPLNGSPETICEAFLQCRDRPLTIQDTMESTMFPVQDDGLFAAYYEHAE